MAKRQPDGSFLQRVDVLDVRLLDLFAHVEALLRYGRVAQRNAIKLRGISTPLTDSERKTILRALRKTITDIDRDSDGLRAIVEAVVGAADDLCGTDGRGRMKPRIRGAAATGK